MSNVKRYFQSKIFMLIILFIFTVSLTSCQARTIIELSDTRGIVLTNDEGNMIPITALETLDRSNLLKTHFGIDEIHGDNIHLFWEYYENSAIPIQQFSLATVYLTLLQMHDLPITVQIISGRRTSEAYIYDDIEFSGSTVHWDYNWEDVDEVSINITYEFRQWEVDDKVIDSEAPVGFMVNFLQLDENDHIIEIESYFFMLQFRR